MNIKGQYHLTAVQAQTVKELVINRDIFLEIRASRIVDVNEDICENALEVIDEIEMQQKALGIPLIERKKLLQIKQICKNYLFSI